jgi:hypothetical protein
MIDDLDAAVQRLREVIERNGLAWREPAISHELQEFSWTRVDKALVMAIDDGELVYLKVWGPHMRNDMEEGPVEDSHFVELWKWLYPEAKT